MKLFYTITFLIISLNVNAQLIPDLSYGNQGINSTGFPLFDTYSKKDQGISDSFYLYPNNSILLPFSKNPSYSIEYPNLQPTIGINKYLENGSLDISFGVNGTALLTASWHGTRFAVKAISVDNNGKIVLAGKAHSLGGFTTDYSFFVCRFNPNGSVDTSFAVNGLKTINFQPYDYAGTNEEVFSDISIDTQNRIIAVGYRLWPGGTNNTSTANAVAMRFLQNGNIDTSFATNGVLQFEMTGADYFSSIYPTTNNEFLLLGSKYATPTQNSLIIAKIDANGSLVSNFGVNGISEISFGTSSTLPLKLFFQSENQIMVTGLNTAGIAFAQLNSNGILDINFSEDGKNVSNVYIPNYYSIGNFYPGMSKNHISMLPDNKFIVTSTMRIVNQYDYIIARFNQNTTLDTTFMNNGVFLSNSWAFDWARAIQVQNDGKVLVLINSSIYRYNNFSTLDNQNFENKNNLNVYPNPTDGLLFFNEVVKNINVSDINGRLLFSETEVDKIDLTNFKNGFYVVSMTTKNDEKKSLKILKN